MNVEYISAECLVVDFQERRYNEDNNMKRVDKILQETIVHRLIFAIFLVFVRRGSHI